MAKKRKSDATTRLDEVDRSIYSSFCSAANSLSQIYTQAMAQQKVAFQAGERHALEKLYQWIMRQHEEGSRLNAADIVAYLQNEIDYAGEDVSMSPRQQSAQQHAQSTMHLTSANIQTLSAMPGPAAIGTAPRTGHSIFSNALSSPVHRSLQPYHLAQGSGTRNVDVSSPTQNRESNPSSSNDSVMDMHSDSPVHESY